MQKVGDRVALHRGILLCRAFAALTCVLWEGSLSAQTDSRDQFDSDYYESYTDMITSRVFLSQKYTALRIFSENRSKNRQYRPNTTLNLGVGATYG